MIKAIIFDWDGVLSKKATEVFLQEFQQLTGIDKDTAQQKYKAKYQEYQLNKITGYDFWKYMAEDSNTDPNQLIEIYNQSNTLYKPMWKLIKQLKGEFKLAILSNNFKESAEYIRNNFDLSLFDEVIFSCDIGIRKPNKEIYNEILKRLNIKPEECIFIDDKERNTLAAAELGFKTVVFTNIRGLKKELF